MWKFTRFFILLTAFIKNFASIFVSTYGISQNTLALPAIELNYAYIIQMMLELYCGFSAYAALKMCDGLQKVSRCVCKKLLVLLNCIFVIFIL